MPAVFHVAQNVQFLTRLRKLSGAPE